MCPLMAGLAAAQRAPPRREGGDGEQKVCGLRRVGTVSNGFRFALCGDEAGVAVFPAFQLAIEKGAARGVVGEPEQMAVQTGDEPGDSIRLPCASRHGIVRPHRPVLCRHRSPSLALFDLALFDGIGSYIMGSRLSTTNRINECMHYLHANDNTARDRES